MGRGDGASNLLDWASRGMSCSAPGVGEEVCRLGARYETLSSFWLITKNCAAFLIQDTQGQMRL